MNRKGMGMDIQKLLFVTNFEVLWFDALQSLLDLRGAALNHVVFLNVIERDRVAMARGAGYLKEEQIKLKEKANARFIDWAERLFEQGMECGVYIVVGALVHQVIETARKEEVDLIVIGPQKKGKLELLYPSSDITEIIRRSDAPVLVYKYLSQSVPAVEHPFERPLLATDWSPDSLRAVDYLKSLHQIVREVNVVHVADEKSLKATSVMEVQKTRKESRARLEKICETLEESGIRTRAHVHIGSPVSEIEKAAYECQATMIMAGTSSRGGLMERLVGSTPKALVEKSIFPTMLFPSEGVSNSGKSKSDPIQRNLLQLG